MGNGKVFKYILNRKINNILIPEYAQILSVQFQKEVDNIVMWVLVDPDNNKIVRNFEMFKTGEDLPCGSEYNYLNTVRKENGLVYHVFEVI